MQNHYNRHRRLRPASGNETLHFIGLPPPPNTSHQSTVRTAAAAASVRSAYLESLNVRSLPRFSLERSSSLSRFIFRRLCGRRCSDTSSDGVTGVVQTEGVGWSGGTLNVMGRRAHLKD